MGAYLSHPKTDKSSSDESNDKLKCGSSSMQGWRVSQEDAHNCILNFDENISLFAVYDGHGGKEVAQYTAEKLPDVIRHCESYVRGDYAESLKEAFLKFDKTLTEPDVIAVLSEIAKEKGDGDATGGEDEEELENIGDLKEEAEMPLADVVAKYASEKGLDPNILKWKRPRSIPVSPFLRAKHAESEDDDGCISSSVAAADDDAAATASEGPESSNAEPSVSSSSSPREITRTSLAEKYANGEVQAPDSSCDDARTVEDVMVNGNSDGEKTEEAKQEAEISSSAENGSIVSKGKGKALVKNSPTPTKKKGVVSPDELFLKFVSSATNGDSSDSDSEDGNFVGQESEESSSDEANKKTGTEGEAAATSVSDDAEKADCGGEDEEEEEEDDDEEEEDDEEEDDDEFSMELTNELEEAIAAGRDFVTDDDDHDEEEFGKRFLINCLKEKRPGSDSGCTAVVALVMKDKVYVANAGDSRCIASKAGVAVDLSLDHKPEDKSEMTRILAAGGRVSSDGRVNGGLNLSRALGDHVYKKTKDLPAEEQMISPLPDIKELELTPDVEFLVLACDGIWNYMSSQEVVEFVRPRLLQKPEKLSNICEELFDTCLAPTTVGDGTGCDNMTAIIVHFVGADLPPDVGGAKRRASSPVDTEMKRAKTDNEPDEDGVVSTSECSSTNRTPTSSDFPEAP